MMINLLGFGKYQFIIILLLVFSFTSCTNNNNSSKSLNEVSSSTYVNTELTNTSIVDDNSQSLNSTNEEIVTSERIDLPWIH